MNSEEQTELRISIKYDNTEDVILLLEALPVDVKIQDGNPLIYAVFYEKMELVKYLLNRGANVNALYEGDYSPLMSAVEDKNIELTKLLLEANADITLRDKYGQDALFKAVHVRNLELIELLVHAGADPFAGEYSAYDSAKDMNAKKVIAYFDSIR